MNENDKSSLASAYRRHIHEQFAINNNAAFSSIVTLTMTSLGILAAYGWVFLHSSLEWDWTLLYNRQTDLYSAPALLLTSSGTQLVLAMVCVILITQGYKQRKEQFVVYDLRKEAGFTSLPWTPYGKTRSDFIVDAYYTLIRLLIIIDAVVIISTFVRVIFAGEKAITYVFAYAVVSVLICCMCISVYHGKYESYQKLNIKNDVSTI